MNVWSNRLRREVLLSSMVVLVLLLPGSAVQAELSLYLDGAPAPETAAFAGVDPLPPLGVHSDTTAGWSGLLYSSDFYLDNGQIDYGKVPVGDVSITPYDAPYGYEMYTEGFEQTGVQFTADMIDDMSSRTVITLWDYASAFNVPVDTLCVWHAGDPGYEDAEVTADAGGPYQLAEGGTVAFDATGSTYTLWYEGDPDPYVHSVTGDANLPYWSIGGVDIAFGLTPTISYEALVGGLGLTPGLYELSLELGVFPYGLDSAGTTIQIIPEPLSGLLLGLGSLGLLRRSRR